MYWFSRWLPTEAFISKVLSVALTFTKVSESRIRCGRIFLSTGLISVRNIIIIKKDLNIFQIFLKNYVVVVEMNIEGTSRGFQ
jgi:hypothetical protein